MKESLPLPGAPGTIVLLRRSPRARRLSLRVSGIDGRVTLTVPPRVPLREAEAFLNDRADWVRGHLDTRPDHVRVGHHTVLPVEGISRRVIPAARGAVRLTETELVLPGAPERAGAKAEAFLRHMARDRIAAAVGLHAARLGRDAGRITLRDTRSRWGSCTSQGNLMLSWRLILAPPDVLDYVVAHEVAHLEEMNHGPAFWALVQRLCPGYATPRGWLRSNGADLHRYRFRD